MTPDEFYMGYLPKAPKGVARFRAVFGGILLLAVLIAAGLAAFAQRPLPDGVFEYGVEMTFEGSMNVFGKPYLHSRDKNRRRILYLLAEEGKHGFENKPEYRGRYVRLKGSLVNKGALNMIEIHGPVVILREPANTSPQSLPPGVAMLTLRGELVDTKCYLGVMRPATGKVHRACAVRCLSGGVPPGLLVHEADGTSTAYYLNFIDVPEFFDPEWGGLTVEVTGSKIELDKTKEIRVASIRRIS